MIFLAPLATKLVTWGSAAWAVGSASDALSNANGFDHNGNYVPQSEGNALGVIGGVALVGAVGFGAFYAYKKIKNA